MFPYHKIPMYRSFWIFMLDFMAINHPYLKPKLQVYFPKYFDKNAKSLAAGPVIFGCEVLGKRIDSLVDLSW